MQGSWNNWSIPKVGIVSAAVGVLILLVLMLFLGFAFWSAFFWGLVIGAVVFIVMLLTHVDSPDQAAKPVPSAAAKPASSPAQAAASPPAAPAAATGTAASAATPDADAPRPDPKPGAAGTAATRATPDADGATPAKPAEPAAPDPAPAPAKAEPAKPAQAQPAASAKDTAAADAGDGAKPATLDAPRGGNADDLKKIKGIGPKLEQLCNSMGFYHFDQIANWSDAEIAWVDQNLEGFRGRVTRDEWVAQAKALAAGEETEFSKKVNKGGVY